MATYTQPTVQEMEQVLGGFARMSLPGTLELVYGKRVDQDGVPLSLRVYTSLNPDGLGRDCGEDAIRVEVYYRRRDGKVVRVGGSKRVNRVPGWQNRLLERIEQWQHQLGPQCQCGAPTILCDGKHGKFYGCSEYPTCKLTQQVAE